MFKLAEFVFCMLFLCITIYAGWLTYNTPVWGTAEWLVVAFLSLELASLFDHLSDREDEKKAEKVTDKE